MYIKFKKDGTKRERGFFGVKERGCEVSVRKYQGEEQSESE